MFGRGEEAELSASSPVPVPGCRVEGVAPQVMHYLVLDRDGRVHRMRLYESLYRFILLLVFLIPLLVIERTLPKTTKFHHVSRRSHT